MSSSRKNVVQMSGVSRTATDVYDALCLECDLIKATADMLFTLDQHDHGSIDGAAGLTKGTTTVMTDSIMNAADRVETLLGEYGRLLRAEHEAKRATSG